MIDETEIDVGPDFVIASPGAVKLNVSLKWPKGEVPQSAVVRAWVEPHADAATERQVETGTAEPSVTLGVTPIRDKFSFRSKRVVVEVVCKVQDGLEEPKTITLPRHTILVVPRIATYVPLAFGLVAAIVAALRLLWLLQHHSQTHRFVTLFTALSTIWAQVSIFVALSAVRPKLSPLRPRPLVLWAAATMALLASALLPGRMHVYSNATGQSVSLDDRTLKPKESVVLGPLKVAPSRISVVGDMGAACTSAGDGGRCEVAELDPDDGPLWADEAPTLIGCVQPSWPVGTFVVPLGATPIAPTMSIKLQPGTCIPTPMEVEVDLKLAGMSASTETLNWSWTPSQTTEDAVKKEIRDSLALRTVKLDLSRLSPVDAAETWSILSSTTNRSLKLLSPKTGPIMVLPSSDLVLERGRLKNVHACTEVHFDYFVAIATLKRADADWSWTSTAASDLVAWCDDPQEVVATCSRTTEDAHLPRGLAGARVAWAVNKDSTKCSRDERLRCVADEWSWECVKTPVPAAPPGPCTLRSTVNGIQRSNCTSPEKNSTLTRSYATEVHNLHCDAERTVWCK